MNVRNRLQSSIRMQIIAEFFLLIILSFSVFLVFTVFYTRSSLERNSKRNSEELVELVNFNIENYVDYMENISQVVMGNAGIQEYLFGEEGKKRKQAEEKLAEEFQTVLKVRKDISNIVVLGDNGRYFINFGEEEKNRHAHLEQKAWYQKARESGEKRCISSSHVQNIVRGRYDWVVTMSHGIRNKKTGKVEGMLFIDLNYNVISDLCDAVSFGRRGYIYIVDEDGDIVYHPQQQLILSGVKEERLEEMAGQGTSAVYRDENGEEKIYTPFQSDKTGWTIVGIAYASELVEGETMMHVIYILLAGTLIFLAVIMAVFMAGNITRPMKQLQEAMDLAKEGDFKTVEIQMRGENEVYKLQQNFNRMICQIEDLMEKNIHEEEEKRIIELKALQSQINPHFLYNTLDSIIWMIEAEEPERAIHMTSALARFFRQTIGKSDIFVTLREELEYTKNYLVIQKMRYEDKIDYKIQVEEGILECQILKLVLQPLVENALYHGLKYKKSVGIIQITGYSVQDKMVLKVADNGVGMDGHTLSHIFDRKVSDGQKHSGVGIANIKRRMQLYYGGRCAFQIESQVNVGTTVTIVIPYEIRRGQDETV